VLTRLVGSGCRMFESIYNVEGATNVASIYRLSPEQQRGSIGILDHQHHVCHCLIFLYRNVQSMYINNTKPLLQAKKKQKTKQLQ